MEPIKLSIGVSAASVLRFIILETAITLVAAPLFTKVLENLAKSRVTSGQAIQIRAVDLGWLTPVNVAYSKISRYTDAKPSPHKKDERGSRRWAIMKHLLAVMVKLGVINALLITAIVSTEMTAGATNERVMVRKPVKRHSDLKRSLAAISGETGVLLNRIIEIDRCTRGRDALYYHTVEGVCRDRETEPSAWATVRGREGELVEKHGDQRLIGLNKWTNNTFEAVTGTIEGHTEKHFFWKNDQVTMYCHDLREQSDLEIGSVNGHCSVMFNAATRRILYLVKVHRTTDVTGLQLTIDRSDYIDVLGIELEDMGEAQEEIMVASVTIAKRYLVLGVSVVEDRIIQEYYTEAATMAKILRTMVDGYGGDSEQIGEYFEDRILATQSIWSVVLLAAVVCFSLLISLATRQRTSISVPFDLSGLIKKLAVINEGGISNSAGKWPVVYAFKVNGESNVQFHEVERLPAEYDIEGLRG
ncbi:hypothetical protein BWQ96_08412 [Gracilariopsis chorda]|uniref:Uncharacterized protein n=1 Tax=Gracilariopsis chorda TaxID=448386 RepID=A0A2V3IIG6_9FLOR|nr:hypothetical protein BWQ96_08412 [Gracilariopsis chorda]|eukprot:PXF41877.1 hypothetical protein BWQ96_08412 [Gracilariopsis chorda]